MRTIKNIDAMLIAMRSNDVSRPIEHGVGIYVILRGVFPPTGCYEARIPSTMLPTAARIPRYTIGNAISAEVSQ